MAFFRRWLLIGFALMLGGTQLSAASPAGERAYAAACASFQDGFYDRAETGLAQFLQNYRKSTNAPQAMLLLAQAEYRLGKFPEAIVRLTDTNNLAKAQVAGLADRYLYWTGEAEFASGDLQGAADTLVSLPDRFPQSSFGLNAVVAGAAALGKLGNWQQVDALLDNTNGVFERAARLVSTNPIIADGRLLQAESRIARQDFSAAVVSLNLLHPKLTLEQDWKRAELLCRANSGRNDLDAALAAAANLLHLARQGSGAGWADKLAESVARYAGLLEQAGRLTDAAAAWRENLASETPVPGQQLAILKIVELADLQNILADAEAGLEAFLDQFPASAPAELARLNLGELHLKDFIAQPSATNHLAAALTNLNQFIAAYTNSPLAGKAYLDRGWCDWLSEEYPQSLSDFQAAAERLPVSEDLALARFKMGDAQFALKDFSGARTNYLAVLTDFSGLTNVAGSLGDRALYQVLRAKEEAHDTAGMEDIMRQLLEKFLANPPTDSSLLLAGQGFSSFGSNAMARAVFQKFELERTNSPLLPQVAFAAARTFEREQNWRAAVTSDEAWLQSYPTHELRPQVEYARDWAVAQAGDEARAFQLFTNFYVEYPTNAMLTPLAYWWVADHYFRLGTNFEMAELNYQLIFQKFSMSELAYRAQLMAGRAAMGRFGYPESLRYSASLISDTNCPGSLRDQARFAYCEAKRALSASETNNLSLQDATNMLSQMYAEAVTNIAGALAWCETGDCDLLMGAFDAATNAYAQVLSSPVLTASDLPPDGPALRFRAQVGLGAVLEKKAEGLALDDRKALLTQALNSYLDVVYARTNEFWVKKAGLQAWALAGNVDIGSAEQMNRFCNRLEELLPQLKNVLEKKRAAVPHP
jgi:TolA-binding protein